MVGIESRSGRQSRHFAPDYSSSLIAPPQATATLSIGGYRRCARETSVPNRYHVSQKPEHTFAIQWTPFSDRDKFLGSADFHRIVIHAQLCIDMDAGRRHRALRYAGRHAFASRS